MNIKLLVILFLSFFILRPSVYSKEISKKDLRLERIEQEIKLSKEKISFIEKKSDYWIYFALSIGAFLGIGIWGLFLYSKKKMKEELTKAIYKTDPTYQPIYIPSTDFDIENKFLKQMGFQKIKPYSTISKNMNKGCIVFCISQEDIDNELQKDKEKDIKNFIDMEKLNGNLNVVIVIYSPGRINGFREINNVTYANTPITLVHQVFIASRMLS